MVAQVLPEQFVHVESGGLGRGVRYNVPTRSDVQGDGRGVPSAKDVPPTLQTGGPRPD